MASLEFPLDIIFDILLLLPVRSLSRFKCVSKSWLSIISSPLFAKTHLHKHSSITNDARLIFSSRGNNYKFTQCSLNSALCGTNTKATELEIPLALRAYPAVIVGSCNGLLCIAIRRYRVGIWNPTIRKFRLLPFDQDLISLSMHRNYKVSYGFGYDDLNDDYKVVKFCYQWNAFNPANPFPVMDGFSPAHPLTVKVYSTKSNSWRRIEEDLKGVSGLNEDRHVIFLNGKIHWIMRDSQSDKGKILTFDLANEKYGDIPAPEFSRPSDIWRWNLGVLGEGCLSLSSSPDFGDDLDIWIMKEYGASQSWNKIASIHLDGQFRALFAKSVFMTRNGEILFHCAKNLACYNPERGSTRKLCISYMTNSWNNLILVDIYKESLIWFEGGQTEPMEWI